ncbi:uncharacterized protein I303_106590 [Kwoniella dejecticola CBS 10117]|uniref:Mediator complex subunit 16 n=1 Tax=Kwoniella dejecticola CBS 10117 TaxID=1296121 RepID=A0A1A5ZU95_9TREE|nr:uncharacterized protein I303_08153 [Kwoniella dejecticola CBS 10117]OBR81383.1 hypothetical protein I303_08153 [Kwoniella dejecticola CBS 10117]
METGHETTMEESPAETSREGLRRMRKLAAEIPSFGFDSSACMHPSTSQLVYPAPTSSRIHGYLTSSIFSSSHPEPLRTPPIFTPAQQLSTSHDGQWTVIFHPSRSSNNSDSVGNGNGNGMGAGAGTGINLDSSTGLNNASLSDTEGGTLAIYPSENLLSPLNLNALPIATFSIPSQPLSIFHLYPPEISLTSGKSNPTGPSPPINYDASNGPSFLLLLESSVLYFYPTPVRNGDIISWQMTYLKSPINTKYHVKGASNPLVSSSFHIQRGWLGCTPSDQGVWLGWQNEDEVGVTRFEVGQDKLSRNYIQATPMPTLPRIPKSPFSEDGIEDYAEQLQSIVFVPLEMEAIKHEGDNGMEGDGQAKEAPTRRVGAALIYNDTLSQFSSMPSTRSRIHVLSFERRGIELAQGFSEIASGNGDPVSIWDWSTVPGVLRHFESPSDTSIVSLRHLSSIASGHSALALISQPAGLSLAHLKLVADQWETVGHPTELGELRGEIHLDLTFSQGAARGQLGLAAIIGRECAPVYVVVPRIEGQSNIGPSAGNPSLAIDAATSIILAEKDGVDWSDVIRAAMGSTGVAKRRDLIQEICEHAFAFASEESEVDELSLLLKVQIALLSSTKDVRLDLASDILKLKEATDLIDKCAIFKDGKITFDLDSIWPLIGVFEWSTEFISDAMRESILLDSQLQLQSDPPASDSALQTPDLDQPLSTIILVHPRLRRIVIKLLSQLNQFIIFIEGLNRPILQPENRDRSKSINDPTNPNPNLKRDAMATIVARDKIRDIAYKEGLGISDWGKSLEQVSSTGISEDDLNSTLFDLSLKPIQDHLIRLIESLPDSSELFLSTTQSQLSPRSNKHHKFRYDPITYLPIPVTPAPASLGPSASLNTSLSPAGNAQPQIRCSRCKSYTEELPYLVNTNTNTNTNTNALTSTNVNPTNTNTSERSLSPWNQWKLNLRTNCFCGGSWEKEKQSIR